MVCMAGCGLKSNPVPSTSASAPIPGEKKMAVSVSDKGIVLTWRFLDESGQLRYMNIERSRLGAPGNVCRDCPRTFERIGQLTVKDVQKEPPVYRFTDEHAEKGNIYSYRLKICTETGMCRESPVVEIDYQ